MKYDCADVFIMNRSEIMFTTFTKIINVYLIKIAQENIDVKIT